jgi:predicted DNA-binding transcriptional regulator YafY
VYHPTTRVLTVLELLQSHPGMTGAEIARRLEVDIRTVRRYIALLEELGVPVTADRGRHGGYRLMPGYKLPPLMFDEDEALALTLGLLAARRLGLSGQAHGVAGALAKVERVLPERVRERVRAVEAAVLWDMRERTGSRPDAGVVVTLSTAAQARRRVALRYRREDCEETERLFDPYGLVCRRGRWYAIGHCHLRGGQRLFRLDRVSGVTLEDAAFERPEGFDALGAVLTSLGSVPRHFPIEVVLETTQEEARRHISADVAILEELAGGGVLLRGYTDNLDWMARLLVRIGCRLEVRQPPELRDALRRHAAQIALWAEAGSSRPLPTNGLSL